MIQLDVNGNVEEYTIILARRDHTHLGVIQGCQEVGYLENLNGANELTFCVYKLQDEQLNEYSIEERKQIEYIWNELVDFKFVYVKELKQYFEIQVDTDDEDVIRKNISAVSACEAELSQTNLYNLEINTELDIARKEYESPTVFYNELKPECSLLHRVLSKVPQYLIGHVDNTLHKIQRTFSANDQDVLSFLTDNVANEIGCLFKFDSVNRIVNVYDLRSFCVDCGYRGEFNGACPKCGSKNVRYFGTDTTIKIDTENLADSISFSVDKDSVKNCFKLEAGDDDMTAAIINRNPNGSSYIYYFSEDQKHEMPINLVEKLNAYDELVKSYDKEYGALIENIYEDIDKILYYTSGMMPKVEHTPTNAKQEAAKLNVANMNPVGVSNLSSSTSLSTINNAMKTFAKVFVKNGWFKVEVNEGQWVYIGNDDLGNKYGNWTGNFKVTNYSDEEDTAISQTIQLTVNDNYGAFLEQKLAKNLIKQDDDGTIFDVLSIKDLARFKEAIKLYAMNRLKSFMDALSGCIDILIESDQANEKAELYKDLYLPFVDKLNAVQAEIDVRQKDIDGWNKKLDDHQKRKREIQRALDFQKFLGDEMYKLFCCYKREQTYTNDNYISDNLDNKTIFENAGAFIEAAKNELYKSGEYQHQISGELFNLLAMPEFEPLKAGFEVGHFIRVQVDDSIYKLRIVQIKVMFDKIQHIDVEFSDVLKIKTGFSDTQSILQKANNMATSYGAVANQVKSSKEQTDIMKDFVNRGLDATTMKIVNNAENQNITISETGLLARQKEDFGDKYSPFQLKLLSNGLYFTDDGFKSVKSAFGKYIYVNPQTGKEEIKYGLMASSIIGQLIIGEQLRLYSNDDTASMSFDDQGLVLNTKKNKNGQYKRIFDIQRDGESIFYVDNKGNLVFAKDQFIEMIEKLERLNVKFLDADNLHANTGNIVRLESAYGKVDELETVTGTITNLTTETLNGASAHFTGDLKTDLKIIAAAGEIQTLNSITGTINDLTSLKGNIDALTTNIANITNLTADTIKANNLDITSINFDDLFALRGTIETFKSKLSIIDDLTATVGKIPTLTVSTKADIEYVIANTANIKKLICDLGEFVNITADLATLKKAVITALETTDATITTLNSTTATIANLNSTNIVVDKLTANSADIKELNAITGDFEDIKAQLANINSILAGNIGTGILQTIHLTAKNVVIDDAVITNLIASKIAVSDLKAGKISTNKFTVESDDGGVVISGSTQQFKDKNNNIRIQMGKDGLGNFNFAVFDETGKGKIFDQDGIKEAGIPNQIIKNDMVANNANISGSKLDINTVVDEINKDGTTTIKSNKVWIDEDNQSLGASFTQMKQSLGGSLKSITAYFAVSKSNDKAPETGWTEILPSKEKDDYIWRKDLITKTDGSTSWTKAYCVTGNDGKDGAPGSNGTDGRGIESVKAEYVLSDRKDIAPEAGWSETHPTWEKGKYLWTRTKITYTNPTEVKYTIPSVDTSWEAANEVQKEVQTLQTDFKVEQGKINALIKDTTIDNADGSKTKIKDKYLEMNATVDGIKTTIGNVETDMKNMTSKITDIEATTDGLKVTVNQQGTDIKNAQSSIAANADKIGMVVKSGTNESNLTLTDGAINAMAKQINLKGLVTFEGLNAETQKKINDSSDTIKNWSNPDAVLNSTTTINGGYIQTNTIDLKQLNVENIFHAGNAVMNIINAQEINANRITSGHISAERLDIYGLRVLHKDTKKETLFINNDGDITMRGTIESYNYSTGNSGWSIKQNGDAEFNDVTVRGSLITDNGGIIKTDYSNTVNLVVDKTTIVNVNPCAAGSTIATFKVNGLKPSTQYTFSVSASLADYFSLDLKYDTKKISLECSGRTYSASFTTDSSCLASYDFSIVATKLIENSFKLSAFALVEGSVAFKKTPLYWAGADYENRNSAPWIVYNDGSMMAQDGTFSGVFSGQVKIGNISIADPSANSGNDALLTIQNGQDGIKKVQLRDSQSSKFAQNIVISDDFYNDKITLKQDGSGVFSTGVALGSHTVIKDNSINMNGYEITTDDKGYLFNVPRVSIGSAKQNATLSMFGESNFDGVVHMSSSLVFDEIVEFKKVNEGLDINVLL